MFGGLEQLTYESVVSSLTPAAKKLFKKYIVPSLESKGLEYLRNKKDIASFEKGYVSYIAELMGTCSTLNTLAFQNVLMRLEDLYVPLTLTANNSRVGNNIVVDKGVNVFSEHNLLFITDAAGMGKSTVAKRIALNVIEEKSKNFPVFIVLRELDADCVAKQICDLLGANVKAPVKFLQQFPITYIFDGLDEVSPSKIKGVVSALLKFSKTFSSSNILLTSRRESSVVKFVNFNTYSIKRLNLDQSKKLIRNFDPSNIVADSLIQEVENHHVKRISTFLETPLYVALLFCCYRYKSVIPLKISSFYEQVYISLFESHDLSKEVSWTREKRCGLDLSDFHSVLRRLAFWCLKEGQVVEFERTVLERTISELASSISGFEFKPALFVDDLLNSVPLFVREGVVIRWSHKSIMEYFATMFIFLDAKDRGHDIMMHFFESDDWMRYIRIFEFCRDIDYELFQGSILKRSIEEFDKNKRSIMSSLKKSRISNEKLEYRAAVSFDCFSVVRVRDEIDIGDSEVSEKLIQDAFNKMYERAKEASHQLVFEVSVLTINNVNFSYYKTTYRGRYAAVIDIDKPGKSWDSENSQEFKDALSRLHHKFRDKENISSFEVINDPDNRLNNAVNFSDTSILYNTITGQFLSNAYIDAVHRRIADSDKSGINKLTDGLL